MKTKVLLLSLIATLLAWPAQAQVPAGTQHLVALSWTAPSPVGGSGTVQGYFVYRAPSGSTTYAKINSTPIAATTLNDTTVASGASYSYCASTVDTAGNESACSIPVTATIPTNPNPPGGMTGTAHSGEWKKNPKRHWSCSNPLDASTCVLVENSQPTKLTPFGHWLVRIFTLGIHR